MNMPDLSASAMTCLRHLVELLEGLCVVRITNCTPNPRGPGSDGG